MRNKHRMQLSIAVYKRFWGCGVGTALMRKIMEKAKEFGFERAELEVVSRNWRAITLYKKLGFEEVGRRKNYYRAPREDAILMDLVLE